MKCIKVVKETKDNKIGTIRRVTDSEADTKVSTKIWAFCPKSEWKLATRKPNNDQATDQATDKVEKVKSKKQLRKQNAEV